MSTGSQIHQIASVQPSPGFVLLSSLIKDRGDRLRNKEPLDSIQQRKLSRMFLNTVKAVSDLVDRGFQVQSVNPESVLVHEESGDIRILLSKSTIQSVEGGLLEGCLIPTFDMLRFAPPEYLEGREWSPAGCSWQIGIMM